ncbi:MAG: hypothetical protein QOD81_4397 [Solirubrobacteraceae bacterium]|nr:hypothetical protein [Solirubrobacteraceae bacterium]
MSHTFKERTLLTSRSTSPRPNGRRRLSKRATLTLVAGVAAIAAGGSIAATAAVPAFPNNVVVFPDRDFVTIEGYQDHIGETGLVEVTRGDKVIGSAKGVVVKGDVAFEINHPGGYCWGAGTGVDVTPDIRPGDKVSIKFAIEDAGDTIVSDTYVNSDSDLSGTTLTVKGHVGPGVNRAQMEQRIVNPELTDTDVGRRDIRAVPGQMTPAPKGGYSSQLTFDGDTFTATYIFDDAATAAIAANGGGERAMAWQEEDADANRQGLTIAEYKEAGGPGMGGCPAGPGDQAAPRPGEASVVRSEDKTSLQVSWAPAEAVPTATAVSGYSVEAIAAPAAGEQVQVGRRTSASATRTTIAGLSASASYTVEVRSLAGAKMSEPFTVQAAAQAPMGDIDPPALTATPAMGAGTAIIEAKDVTLASEATAEIYYTTDGSAVVSAGLPTSSAKLYTGPVVIASQVLLKVAVFDAAGNITLASGTYKPAPDTSPAPNALAAPTGTAGQQAVSLKWTATDTTITGYGVTIYNVETGTTEVRETTAKTLNVTGLTANTPYQFTVKAKNTGGWGPESDKTEQLTPTVLTDRVTIGTAKWKSGDFRVTGTVTAPGTVMTLHTSAAGPSIGGATSTAAVAPETGGVYDIRLRNGNAPATRPAQVWVKSAGGGVAGPFPVTQG